jgi:hypothetical protein
MTYHDSAQIYRADQMPDGRLIIWWNESESLVFENDQAFLDYCTDLTPQIKLLLRTLLLLDYSEQRKLRLCQSATRTTFGWLHRDCKYSQ